jgi:hypothetical protein
MLETALVFPSELESARVNVPAAACERGKAIVKLGCAGAPLREPLVGTHDGDAIGRDTRPDRD